MTIANIALDLYISISTL